MDEFLALEPPDRGALFVVTGPSGVGKSTLIRKLMVRLPGLDFSISATTRAARVGEVDGKDYHFLDANSFESKVIAGEFLEHATVYDRRYGTLRAPIEQAIAHGRSVVLDIDVQGARQVKAAYPECVRVFILPPSVQALEDRIRARGTDSEEVLRRRMAQLDEQLRGAPEFDYVVINDVLFVADAVFQGIFLAELSRPVRRRAAIERVLGHAATVC